MTGSLLVAASLGFELLADLTGVSARDADFCFSFLMVALNDDDDDGGGGVYGEVDRTAEGDDLEGALVAVVVVMMVVVEGLN